MFWWEPEVSGCIKKQDLYWNITSHDYDDQVAQKRQGRAVSYIFKWCYNIFSPLCLLFLYYSFLIIAFLWYRSYSWKNWTFINCVLLTISFLLTCFGFCTFYFSRRFNFWAVTKAFHSIYTSVLLVYYFWRNLAIVEYLRKFIFMEKGVCPQSKLGSSFLCAILVSTG